MRKLSFRRPPKLSLGTYQYAEETTQENKASNSTPSDKAISKNKNTGISISTSTNDSILVMPLSSFDFLEGKFKSTSRTRVLNFSVVTLVILVTFTFIASSIATSINNNKVEASSSAAAKKLVKQNLRIDKFRESTGGETKAAVESHVKNIAALAATVSQNQVEYSRILRDVYAAGTNVTITEIVFSTPTDASMLAILDISGQAASVSDATGVAATFANKQLFPYLSPIPVAATIKCGETSKESTCIWSWQGAVDASIRGSRSLLIQKTYKVSPKVGPAPTAFVPLETP